MYTCPISKKINLSKVITISISSSISSPPSLSHSSSPPMPCFLTSTRGTLFPCTSPPSVSTLYLYASRFPSSDHFPTPPLSRPSSPTPPPSRSISLRNSHSSQLGFSR
ncbi:unnamed protein product [Brassica oleracea var. botrytis]